MIKNKLRELRFQNDISQIKLANDLGVTRQTINALEKQKYDNPTLELSFKICRYFNLSIEEVFEYKEEK